MCLAEEQDSFRMYRGPLHSASSVPRSTSSARQPFSDVSFVFGSSVEEAKKFFKREDDLSVAWNSWKRLLFQEEEEKKKRQQFSEANTVSNSLVPPTLGKLAITTKLPFKSSFSDRQVARRNAKLLPPVNSSITLAIIEQKLSDFRATVQTIIDLIHPKQLAIVNASPVSVDTQALENRYDWLLHNSFSHVAEETSVASQQNAKRTFTIASFSLPQHLSFLFTFPSFVPSVRALPSVMLMDSDVIESAEKELRSLRYNLKLLKVLPSLNESEKQNIRRKIDDESTAIDSLLHPVDVMLQNSKYTLNLIARLSSPYIKKVNPVLLHIIERNEKELLSNDEATEEKRKQAKELHKEKSALLHLQSHVLRSAGDIAKSQYRNTDISAHTFVVGLALVAKFRLGVSTGFEDLDMLSKESLEDNLLFLGMLWEEFVALLVTPLAIATAVFTCIWFILQEIQKYYLVRKIRRRTVESNETRIQRTKGMRHIVIFFLVAKAILFIFLPFLLIYMKNRQQPVKLWEIIFYATPSIRFQFGVFFVAFYLLLFLTLHLLGVLYESVRPLPLVNSQADKKKK